MLELNNKSECPLFSVAITRVSRELYDGKVYNLKVGWGKALAGLTADQSTIYANGFLVGDGKVQAKYQSQALKAKGSILERLPKKWHQDYHSQN